MPKQARDVATLNDFARRYSTCPICWAGRPKSAEIQGVGSRLVCKTCDFEYVLPWPQLRKRFRDLLRKV